MDFLLLALACCSVVVFAAWVLRSSKLPPGPWGFPLIGHLHLFRGQPPYKALQSISQKFGPIVYFRLGMIPTVLVSSPDLAREILTTQDAIFSSRPYFVAGEYMEYGFKGLGSAPYGEHYRGIRKLCATELFTVRSINSFAPVRKQALSHFLGVVLDCHSKNEAVELRRCLSISTFNAVTQISCSKKYFSFEGSDGNVDPDAAEFKELVRQMVSTVFKPCLSNFVPSYLRWLDWEIPRLKWLQAKADKFLQKIVDEHRATSREQTDFVDILMNYFGEGDEADTYTKATLIDLLTAGTESSVVSSEWLLAVMMHNPRVMKKLQEELDKVVGPSRMVRESDLSNLDYFQAIIKETMRRHPTAPMLMPRIAMCDTEVGGYHIPKGTTLMINSWGFGRDASVWKNPNGFIPERFVGSSIDYKGQSFELLPFGSGRRKCPGMALAMRIVELLVANLVHGFDWAFETAIPPSMEEAFGTVCLLETPLRAMATPRLPKDTYTTL